MVFIGEYVMRFLAVALIFALWQGDTVRAQGRAAIEVRRQLIKRVKGLDRYLSRQMLAGMNVGVDNVILGIDLGTTYSAMAIAEKSVSRIIPNREGDNTTPSVVDFSPGGGVGKSAEAQLEFFPERVVYSSKRLMGLMYKEAQEKGLIDNLAYRVVEGDGGMAMLEIDGERYKPQIVAAQILKKLKEDAELTLGREITRAVITVPARFDDRQIRATKEAGQIAGLEVELLVAEPTAAFLAHDRDKGEEMNVLVYDLGGGTFDVSILDFTKLGEGEEMSEVITTEGNPLLGGDDFDNKIVNYLVAKLKEQTGVDVSGDQEAMAELKTAATEAKEALSGSESTTIRIKKLGEQSLAVNETLTRARFTELISDLVAQTIAMTEKALNNKNLTVDDIGRVLMVGGSTRVASVSEAVEALFGAEKVSREDNPDEVVALGAAMQAGVLSGEVSGVTLLGSTTMDLGIEVKGGIFALIIAKDTNVPVEQTQTFTTEVDNQPAVTIGIYEGEATTPEGKPSLVQYNHKIGEFTLSDIPPAPQGVPQIDVTFAVDANKIVTVTAKDKGTNRAAELTVNSDAMSEEQIAEMRESLEKNKDKINAKAGLRQAQNRLDTLLVQAEGLLRNSGDKMSAQAKDSLTKAVAAARTNINSDNIEAIENSIKGFESEIHAVTTELYGQADTES